MQTNQSILWVLEGHYMKFFPSLKNTKIIFPTFMSSMKGVFNLEGINLKSKVSVNLE